MSSTRYKKHAAPQLRVGDRVSFEIAGTRRRGTIVEDRGPLGVDGGRLLAIRTKLGDTEFVFEMPAEELRRVRSAA